ncbi:hypothetical protein ANTPLA_LOCUS1306 [Anthophora plagiata]
MKVTACEIFNQVDSKCYTLYTEWFNSHFKVILLEPTMSPLYGEMCVKDVNYFSDELSKSTDEYLKETEKILCQKDKDIKFFIQDKTLVWKNNVWTMGQIELCPIYDISVISERFQQLSKLHQSVQDKLNTLEKENENLIHLNKELSLKIEKMIEMKTSMEQELYSKFVTILNSKKRKIKELEDAMKEKRSKESIFDAQTDESEESEREDPPITIKIGKRKSQSNSSVDKQKTKKLDCIVNSETACNTSNSDNFEENKKHTMREKGSVYEKQSSDSKDRTLRTSLNFNEEEPEEELFSQ